MADTDTDKVETEFKASRTRLDEECAVKVLRSFKTPEAEIADLNQRLLDYMNKDYMIKRVYIPPPPPPPCKSF